MKHALVFGAGLVAGPLVRYLLDQPDIHVTVASRTVDKAHALVGDHPRGRAVAADVEHNPAVIAELVPQADLAVSMLPYTYHVQIAQECIKHGKHLVTTSYVSDAMRALDGPAREAGVTLLNEIGLDPGIDHMEAMRVIHQAQRNGGRIVSFRSYCGGLPAPDSITTPFAYKFSWSPRGVLMAGRNPAHYRQDGHDVHVPGPELFAHYEVVHITGLGDFEGYPNRDSMPYAVTYGINDTRTMFRGTLRNLGWCDTMRALTKLGLLDAVERDDLTLAPDLVAGLTWAGLLRQLVGRPTGDLRQAMADYLGLEPASNVLDRIAWLGLLADKPLPKPAHPTLMDVLAAQMRPVLKYALGERDMIVLQHEFDVEYQARPGEHSRPAQHIVSTLIDYGIPHGETAMSRTVGLPAAIGAKMILTGDITATGVQIPVEPGIYEPVLAELARQDIAFQETIKPL
ncbi:MAG: saccharopine dehydrogenase NADP-binding domain-containing protein [Chloroflexi bacterium]|nr:saccharopine dehydrogenase NADP-binding domain-containing protein [Chloroflexota bacterium]MBU1747905.1 saccharopine dehydrogenase NADP-binding domain-containing protein [Chloroflexota bacterium]